MSNRAFWEARITRTQALITAYEDAVESLVSGKVKQYTIDTGQTRQTVTRLDVENMQSELDKLYNRLATLEARVYGRQITARPAW